MSRRFRAPAVALLVTALAVTLSGCSGSDDKKKSSSSGAIEKVTYLTGMGAQGRDAYAWVAQEKGYFKDANLEVTINLGSGTGENMKGLVSEKAQFAAIDMSGGMMAMTAKENPVKDVRAIAAIHQQNMVGILTLEGKGISTPKDLEGKKIGVVAGSVNEILFPTYAKLAGVDNTKINWTKLQTSALIGALVSGQVDAISTMAVGQASLEKLSGGKKAVLLPFNTYMSDLYGAVIFTSSNELKTKPDVVKRFRTAILKGLKYAVEHPDEAGKILNKYQPNSDATAAMGENKILLGYADKDANLGMMTEQRMAKSIATLEGSGTIPAGTKPADFVDFSASTVKVQ